MSAERNMPVTEQKTRRSEIRSLQNEIERVFDDFWSSFGHFGRPPLFRPFFKEQAITGQDFTPSMDLTETDAAYIVTAELPGMHKEDVSISLADDVLSIKGEKKSEKEEKTENVHFREMEYGSFSRSIRIPGTVDAARVEAKMKDGVLTVHLPKSETVNKLDVKIED